MIPTLLPALRRLVKLARLATLTGKDGPRDYAGAFRAIGPAAIKLGQSLATRPDLVGEEAANNLLSLQDSLPPVPVCRNQGGDRIEIFRDNRSRSCFARNRSRPRSGAASIAQRAQGRDHRWPQGSRSRLLRPGHSREIRAAISQPMNVPLPMSRRWGVRPAPAPAGLTIANFKRWTNSALDLRR